ncbi:MAG: hypothetical protein DWQ34_06920 [Planctomycetota bacterium]|nr:MAG: hypothetical protein DWQ34_06920 [Planctomycetota bacterium]
MRVVAWKLFPHGQIAQARNFTRILRRYYLRLTQCLLVVRMLSAIGYARTGGSAQSVITTTSTMQTLCGSMSESGWMSFRSTMNLMFTQYSVVGTGRVRMTIGII